MNLYQKIAILLFLISGFFIQSFKPAKAQVVTPGFPTCSNPIGTLKVSYDNGVHGIVGSTSQFSGSDHVYSIDDLTSIQCFCSEEGNGIQTNWWKITSLTQNEINTLKNLGWVFVPSGSVWGLDDAAYMAKSSDYACGNSTSSNGNDNNNGSSGEVLGISTSSDQGEAVLGLAATGNSLALYILLITGFAFIASGRLLKMKMCNQN